MDAPSFGDKIRRAVILNPKRDPSCRRGRAGLYGYYAGFSPAFAREALGALDLSHGSVVLDPWNGSGTTTAAAGDVGSSALGYDLNPAMVVAAKAVNLYPGEAPSLDPIACDIVHAVATGAVQVCEGSDPLCRWLIPSSAECVRRIERRIHALLVDSGRRMHIVRRVEVDCLSEIACFFYVALFRTLRTLLDRFCGSNPTWIRSPKSPMCRIRPRLSTVLGVFMNEVKSMTESLVTDGHCQCGPRPELRLAVASSEALPLSEDSVDVVLSSPPYCTRIDYAVATRPELAVLGYDDIAFEHLRRALIGTATVPRTAITPSPAWGTTCQTFLAELAAHRSKASGTYYYKNHVQYFGSVFRSLAELHRVLVPAGLCVLVVQDSYYKDLHNDLPSVFSEMAAFHGLRLHRRVDFGLARTMGHINPKARAYRSDRRATESVLCFLNG